MSPKNHQKLIILTKIVAILICLFGLPFYFGYGNPMPFLNSSYSLWDNMWLTIFPFMFAGLLVGLKNQRLGGLITTISVGFGLIVGTIIGEFISFMFIPFIVGILYLALSKKPKKSSSK